jgi:hypothetical protein
MTKPEIKKIINDINTNKDIKWNVLENTPNKIVLTNSYDRSIRFTIEVKESKHEWDDENWIVVKDNLTGATVYVLIQGEDRWSDYKETEQGLIQAVKITVAYFNRKY